MLHLRLLGPIRINQSQNTPNTPLSTPRFRSRRTMALLGYLAAEKRPIARNLLAALFWPNEVASKGRANLRRELHNLARILPDCWVLDRQAVAFVPSKNATVDLYTLLVLEAEGRWDEAAMLLSGQFLEGLYLESNSDFDNWLMAERERWLGQATTVLTHVIEDHTQYGRYAQALEHNQRLLQLSPWNEAAHQQAMRLLAWSGKRGAALRQFEQCKQAMWEELSAEPAEETAILYQQIQAGELDTPPQLPAFLTGKEVRHKVARPHFVAREGELGQLGAHLKAALAGQSQIIFVTGGPGRGKTALMDAFAEQAMVEHADLLVANGNCNAYSGIGDPYLPFRDLMAMLTGDVETRWNAGAITDRHARYLWDSFPRVLQAMIERGTHLLDVLVPAKALLSRAVLNHKANSANVLRLNELVNNQTAQTQAVDKSFLFQEITEVLQAVAQEQPLLLFLDNIQWADAASISLIFHLGRRLTRLTTRILIICAYRPEEVAFGWSGARHPLTKVLNEFKRTFGDIWIGLGPTKGMEDRDFVDALLDSEPNQLTEGFRSALLQRTKGHPLFTVELLQTMAERGDLFKNEYGYLVEGPSLDWEILPARTEAVIEERVNRLEPEWQELLAIASVEGEVFTAQIVAKVQAMEERPLLRILARELAGQHKLVREYGEVQTDHGQLSRYSFGHALFQEYLYKRLSPGERRLLHADVAMAMETLYAGKLDEMAVQLGHHFLEARDYDHALPYFTLAAERATRMYANDEAITHYTRAVELAEKVSLDALSQAKLYRGRGLVYESSGNFMNACADLEAGLDFARDAGGQQVEWRLLLDLGKLWASRDYNRTRHYFERALELAHGMNDTAVLAGSLNWMGNWYANAEDPIRAAEYLQDALENFEKLGDRRSLANTLDLLGNANLLRGNLSASVGYLDRAITLFQNLDDRSRLISSLISRGTTVSLLILLATAPAITPPDAIHDLEEAIRIAREIHLSPEIAWAHWSLGLLHTVHGQFGRALKVMQNGLEIASEIGHGEWLVGNRFALGVLYAELFVPEEAQQHLEQALDQAKELQSQYWINHVSGALATAYQLLDNPTKARSCLENVLAPQTAMDTMGKRYCWARRAELALFQSDSALALDIVDRLITSAPNVSPDSVITFLWKLKGDVLADVGRTAEAESWLNAALSNARAQNEQFLVWRVYTSLSQLYRTLNRHKEAQQAFSTAWELIGGIADTIPDKTLQDNFLRQAQNSLDLR